MIFKSVELLIEVSEEVKKYSLNSRQTFHAKMYSLETFTIGFIFHFLLVQFFFCVLLLRSEIIVEFDLPGTLNSSLMLL